MRVFVSYRRADLGGHADLLVGRLFDRLSERFGAQNVFVDVYGIDAGEDFPRVLERALAQSDCLLVVIGPDWQALWQACDPETDYVALEIGQALARNKVVIPILVGGAAMPGADVLPAALQAFPLKNAMHLRSGAGFDADVADLERQILTRAPETSRRVGRFEARTTASPVGRWVQVRLLEDGEEIRYARVLDLWNRDPDFVDFFNGVFRTCGFGAYVWETPPISTDLVDRVFECTLHNMPVFAEGPDHTTFSAYFDTDTAPDGIVQFRNLGADALLVVPSPTRPDADYSGLAEFLRQAPIAQQRGLWREVARCVWEHLSDRPMWVSVAGGGIKWLHIRLDSAPKYYRTEAYTVT